MMLKSYCRFVIALLSGRIDRFPTEDMLVFMPQYQQRAVWALVQKQELFQRIERTQELIDNLREKVTAAGEREEQPLLEELRQQEQFLGALRESLVRSEKAVAETEEGIRQEQERLREKRRNWGTSWTPAVFPHGRNSPDSVAKLVVMVLIAFLVEALIHFARR